MVKEANLSYVHGQIDEKMNILAANPRKDKRR
jgi:hypothetical protein